MIKWALAIFVAFTLTGTASAGIVDFSATYPGITPSCIATTTINPSGCLVSGVTFTYDPGGDPLEFGTATVGANGVDIYPGSGPTGYIGGTLTMTLQGAVEGGMSFDFTYWAIDPTFSGVNLILYNGGVALPGDLDTATSFSDASGMGNVTILHPSTAWDSAQVQVIVTGAEFGLNIGAVTTDMPEPGSYALLGSGLLMLAFGSRKLARRRS